VYTNTHGTDKKGYFFRTCSTASVLWSSGERAETLKQMMRLRKFKNALYLDVKPFLV